MYVPRHARSDPMQLLGIVARKLVAEPGFTALGKAISQDLQPLPGDRGFIVLTETSMASIPHDASLGANAPKQSVKQLIFGTLAPVCVPRHARSASDPMQLLHIANPRKGLRGNPAGTRKVATLPRVGSLDHGAGSGFRKQDRYRDVDKVVDSMELTLSTQLDVLHSCVLCTSLDVLHSDVLHSVYYALYADSVYLILCSSLNVLHSDVLHSVYYALYAASVYLILCSSLNVLHSDVLHSVYSALYADSVYLILCSSLNILHSDATMLCMLTLCT